MIEVRATLAADGRLLLYGTSDTIAEAEAIKSRALASGLWREPTELRVVDDPIQIEPSRRSRRME